MTTSVKAVRRIARAWCGPVVLVGLVLWMLHRDLFSGGTLLPAWPQTDLHTEFLGWRYFAFHEWIKGHFPFWNPRVFGGIPFFAQIQSCLLYPIAWVNFLFETSTAVTIEIAANVAIAGTGTYAWARQRGTSRGGATLAGAAFAFSGPVYVRVTAGHMTPLATLAWVPLLFLALDRLLAERFLSGILLGSFAVCMQWLGGHPQLAYYTGLVAGAYLVINAIGKKRFLAILAGFVAIYVLGSLLPAIQIIPAILASSLSVRSGAMSYEFAATFPFPLENLLTFLIPYPLGDIVHLPYVGRWYIWEASGYIGVINLALVAVALARTPIRQSWRMLAVLAITFILMLGANTPVYMWLWRFLPGFSTFRGTSKFSILLVLLLSVLAGDGFDWMRKERMAKAAVATAIIAALCFLLGGIFLKCNSTSGPMARLMEMVFRSGEYYNDPAFFKEPWVPKIAAWAGYQWFLAGGLLIILSLRLYFRRWGAVTVHLLLALAIADVFTAAWISSVAAKSDVAFPEQWTRPIDLAIAADQRVLFLDSLGYGNSGNILGVDSLWGYDPAQPRRYSDLIAVSQHEHPAAGGQYIPGFSRPSRIFQMLRCEFVLQWQDPQVFPVPNPMPHVQLIGNYVRMADPKAIEAALAKDFDFRNSVILESDPSPPPAPGGAGGQVHLVRQSINDLEIVADLPAPALLLITDNYAPGWHVRAMERNPNQSTYEILPADDVLRAIPLAAGHHHFDVYYIAPGWWLGAALSSAGFICWAWGFALIQARRRRVRGAPVLH